MSLTPYEQQLVRELLREQELGGHSADVQAARQAGELAPSVFEYRRLESTLPTKESAWKRAVNWFRSMLGKSS